MPRDTGFIAALAAGLATGGRAGEAAQEYELARERIALAQQQAEIASRQTQRNNRLQDDALRRADEDRRRAASRDDATREFLTDEYRREVLMPQLGAASGQADWSQHGQSMIEQAIAAQSRSDAFGRMGTDAMENALKPNRAAQSAQKAAELKKQIADETLQRKLAALWSSSIAEANPGWAKRQEQQLIMKHTADVDELPMMRGEYEQSPAYRTLPPEYQDAAMSVFETTGSPPGPEWMGRFRAANPDASSSQAAMLAARMSRQKYQDAAREAEIATQALQDFDKAAGDTLLPPTDKDGNLLPQTDPRWQAYNATMRKRQPLARAAETLNRQRAELYALSQREADAALGITPPTMDQMGEADTAAYDAAAKLAMESRPDLDPSNPAHLDELERITEEFMRAESSPAP